MSGSPVRRADVEQLVGAYRADLAAAGMFAAHPVTSVDGPGDPLERAVDVITAAEAALPTDVAAAAVRLARPTPWSRDP